MDLGADYIIGRDYFVREGKTEKDRGIRLDGQCRNILDNVTVDKGVGHDTGKSKYVRLSIKMLDYIRKHDEDFYNELMQNIGDEL